MAIMLYHIILYHNIYIESSYYMILSAEPVLPASITTL